VQHNERAECARFAESNRGTAHSTLRIKGAVGEAVLKCECRATRQCDQ
jgi:hypothetical protein